MRIARRTLVKISAVTLLLTAGVLCLFRDALRVEYHLGALRHAEQRMFAPQPCTFPQQVMALLVRRPSWEDWSALRSRHEDALIRMGYLARREFPLTNPQLTAGQLARNAQRRFGSQFSTVMVIKIGRASCR